jgi:AraC family transcriptional regulator
LQTAAQYDESLPAEVILSSQSANWRGLELTEFLFPTTLPETPAPGLPCHAFAALSDGIINGECSVNGGPWKRRYLKHTSIESMDIWPEEYVASWRWWPAEEFGKSLKITIAYLKQEFLKKTAAEVFDVEPNRIEVASILSVKDEFMRQLVLAAKNELAQGNPCGPIYAETAAQMLALHVISRHCTLNYRINDCTGGLSKARLRMVLDYIDSHLHEEISLEILASLAGVTSYHFLRLFKQSTGETPLQFIIHSRMERAKELLAAGMSVTDVALDVGYESVSHFITLFKRRTGVTPFEYRRKL